MRTKILCAVSICFVAGLTVNAQSVAPKAQPLSKDSAAAAPSRSAASQKVIADSTKPAAAPSSAPSPAPRKVRMFAQSQCDSVLGLLPAGDSIRAAGAIIGIGVDTVTHDIVLVYFDSMGDPRKAVVPAAALTPGRPAAPASSKIATITKPKPEQNGRTWFILESTLKSCFVYPSSYAAIFHHAEGSVIGGVSLLTVGGVLYGSFAFTKGMELGYGKTGLMNYGSTLLGGYYPQLLSTFLHNATSINDSYVRPEIEFRPGPNGTMVPDTLSSSHYEDPTATDQIKAWTAMAGFPLGAYLGSRWALVNKDDAGRVSLMVYFSQTLGALAFALPVFYYDRPSNEDSRHYLAAASGLSMALLPAGIWTGYRLTENKQISTGRGTLPWVTGTMGALTGMGLMTLPDKDNGIAGIRTLLGVGIIGYGAGTYLGLSYHPAIDYTYWQTVFIGASSAAGAAMGIAFPLIAQAERHQPYIIAAILGGWTGFFLGERLSLSLFEKSSRDKRPTGLRLDLPGLAALPLMAASPKTGRPSLRPGEADPGLPVANLEWKF